MQMLDLAGTWWISIIVVATILLGFAIGFGSWQWKHAPRDHRTMQKKDAATRANFKEDAVEERPIMGEAADRQTKR